MQTLRQASQELGSPRQSWHLSLRFIHKMDSQQLQPLAHSLTQIAWENQAFELALDQPGSFPGVLWYGLQPSLNLKTLQKEIDEAVSALNLPAADYGYNPHITLARSKTKTAENLKTKNVQTEWLAKSFELRQSKPNQDGAICLYRFNLKSPSD